MDTLFDEQEQDLSNLLRVKDKDGRVALTIGLLVTVYFTNQLTRGVREAVADVAQEYIDLVWPHLRWTSPPNVNRDLPIKSKRMKLPSQWLQEHPDGEDWEFTFFGGETPKSASEFYLQAFGSKAHADGGMGFLHLSFPLLWFAERSETFPEYVLRMCRRIRPLNGYAGIGVLEPSDGFFRTDFQPVVREIAARHPGLEIENRPGHTNELLEGIKGVNWLTILGERWVKEMGGLESLSARLDDSFGFYPYDGGLIIQAGPKPQVGDAQANRWPKHYITLAKVLKKIQITDHCAFHFAGKGQRMNREISKAWLFRFDDK